MRSLIIALALRAFACNASGAEARQGGTNLLSVLEKDTQSKPLLF